VSDGSSDASGGPQFSPEMSSWRLGSSGLSPDQGTGGLPEPGAFLRIYRNLGSGLVRPVESTVPKCEGPGHPHLWFTKLAGPGPPAQAAS